MAVLMGYKKLGARLMLLGYAVPSVVDQGPRLSGSCPGLDWGIIEIYIQTE